MRRGTRFGARERARKKRVGDKIHTIWLSYVQTVHTRRDRHVKDGGFRLRLGCGSCGILFYKATACAVLTVGADG